MRILLITPLYPPDVAPAAEYAKELAARFAPGNRVTVLAYGRLPEPVAGVRVRTIDKRTPRFIRIPRFFLALMRELLRHDAILVINGASAELPFLLASYLLPRPSVFILADAAAHARAREAGLHERARHRASLVLEEVPPPRPRLISFLPPPDVARSVYEAAWDAHLAQIVRALAYA